MASTANEAFLTAPAETPFNLPVNVFSSYISDATARQCQAAQPTKAECKNDGIAANDFLTALEQLSLFTELSPSLSQYDYELLIANQISSAPDDAQARQSYTEFSVEWRGMQLDSHLVQYQHRGAVTPKDVEQIILHWWQHAEKQQIFTTPYLYQAMGASDYTNQLVLPESLNEFELSRQYLYPDPFKGVLARYLHPNFTEAVLDITIYPVLSVLDGQTDERLSKELTDAINEARETASAREMSIDIKQHQTPFIHESSPPEQGLMSEMVAESDSGESLYASIYVFQLEDKFVKISTTFPARVGDELVRAALKKIKVPPESPLMKELRLAL
ncbi:hypothetical protein [Alteromonas gilva]|uniref:Uncharacterized protein n=1 Tax=Alteromonas gilva TaxID=2987522 RepID=A0ABT5L6N1_9ALTE|nr:hypothetical protein [Alteromonas gilva]MDC8832705.1 hypothetical protein [Alteromonas gilva]